MLAETLVMNHSLIKLYYFISYCQIQLANILKDFFIYLCKRKRALIFILFKILGSSDCISIIKRAWQILLFSSFLIAQNPDKNLLFLNVLLQLTWKIIWANNFLTAKMTDCIIISLKHIGLVELANFCANFNIQCFSILSNLPKCFVWLDVVVQPAIPTS